MSIYIYIIMYIYIHVSYVYNIYIIQDKMVRLAAKMGLSPDGTLPQWELINIPSAKDVAKPTPNKTLLGTCEI